MEGFGVLAPNGSKIAMLYPDKVSVLSWPDKTMVKEIIIDMRETFETSSSSNTGFSDDGRYLFIKSHTSIMAYDLVNNTSKEIKIPDMVDHTPFFYTEDGKYLLINPYGTEETKKYFFIRFIEGEVMLVKKFIKFENVLCSCLVLVFVLANYSTSNSAPFQI
jgi:hypothetical protein